MATYRVFCDKKQAKDLPAGVTLEQSYPAFSIVGASANAIRALKKKFPIEELAEKEKAGTMPQLKAAVASPSGKGAARHFKVRFKAPVKKSWITALEEAGAHVADKHGSSQLVVTCPSATVLRAVEKHAAVVAAEAFVPEIKLDGAFLTSLQSGGSKKATKKALSAAADALASGKVKPATGRGRTVPGAVVARFLSAADARRAQKVLSAHGAKSSYANSPW